MLCKSMIVLAVAISNRFEEAIYDQCKMAGRERSTGQFGSH
jgi:hypothetical protein